jgi:glycerol kinase
MSSASSILVVDVGTSGVRAAIVRPDGSVDHVHHRRLPPSTPFPGLAEVDGRELAATVLQLAERALTDGGPVAGVGVANQRASTLVWDRRTGEPVGPGLGWQDLRTIMECLTLNSEGWRLAPNQSATKLAALLDAHDPSRSRDLCFGTVDTWVAWTLSGGALHVTDQTNAAVTGLRTADGEGWDERLLERLRIPAAMLPDVVDSSGAIGEAAALPGSPPVCGLAGDQQASLVGQGCLHRGQAKLTFGTGGMLDMVLGPELPAHAGRGPHGCFPVVAWSIEGRKTWGVEAIMLSAGSAVDWLVEDLGLLPDAAASHEVAASCPDSGGVWFVPALLGLGTPHWDYGARGTMLGLTRGSGRAQLVRAVLEGIAHRGADLVDAAEADTGTAIATLRVDGGMSANPTFVQALADASGRPVEVSPVLEATTLGAAYLAGAAAGTWPSLDAAAATWEPRAVVDPGPPLDRDRWRQAVTRAITWEPELSALDF